jgi:FAD synthase
MAESKRSVLTIRVPQRLKSRIEKYSALEGVSINQFALYAFAKEIAELETNRYFRQRLRGKKKEDLVAAFDAAMAKVLDRKPPKWDRL